MSLKKWWKKASKTVAKVGAGVVGGVAGFMIGGPAGAAAGASLGYGLADSAIGAIDRNKEAKDAARDLKEQRDLAREQLDNDILIASQAQAMERDQAMKQADMAAQQADINAENIGEQSRAAEINKFQQESAALASSGSSGIAEGSPYMALESSVNEMGRQIDSWFNNSVAGQGFAGAQTSMMLEGARFNDRTADLNISMRRKTGEYNIKQIEKARREAKDAASGWNFALDLTGGILSSVANAYSLGTTVGAIDMTAKAMGGYKEFFSNGNFLKAGSALKYGQMTGDMSHFHGLNAGIKAPSGNGLVAPGNMFEPYMAYKPSNPSRLFMKAGY